MESNAKKHAPLLTTTKQEHNPVDQLGIREATRPDFLDQVDGISENKSAVEWENDHSNIIARENISNDTESIRLVSSQTRERLSTSDSESAYDTDIDVADEETHRDDEVGIERYKLSCIRLDVHPHKKVVDQLRRTTLDISHQGIGSDGAKALSRSLVRNTRVEKLGLSDNSISPDASLFVGDMLRDNIYITNLNLSDNDLGTIGAAAIGDMLIVNTGLTHLTLSGCRLKDSDAAFIASGIEKNERLIYLDLSHNEFREDGTMLIGKAIGINNSIEYLSMAWNHIRRKGAVELCKALKRNYSITVADLSWNGLAYDGAVAMSSCLKTNKYLREVDIACNRIDWKGASLIASGLKENSTLEVFKVGQNPLTMTGCFEILQAVNNPSSELEFLGFDGIPINNKIAYAAERISKTRDFALSHGGIIETNDVLGQKLTKAEDPLNLLMQFMNDRDLRPLDLFRTFDKGRDQMVTKEQFIRGLRKARVPLELWQIHKVTEILDKDAEGRISYRKLNAGVKEKKLQNKIDDLKAKLEKKKTRDMKARLMNPDMPTPPLSSRILGSGEASLRSSLAEFDASRRSSRLSFTPLDFQSLRGLRRPSGFIDEVSSISDRDAESRATSGRYKMPPIPTAEGPALTKYQELHRRDSRISVGDSKTGSSPFLKR